jgi:membrane protein YqaA with SNARE-associated domain
MGAFGLFLLSALDSSFLFLPFGNDVLLLALVSSERTRLTWILYVVVSAVGSLVGVLLIDLIMRNAGEKGLERFIGPKRLDKLKSQIENKAGITVFVSTMMPPPFPFTPVVMTASALQCTRSKLFGAVLAGRLIRFTVEALLALYFGRRVIRYINSDVFAYLVYALMAIAFIGSAFSTVKWLNHRKQVA